LAELKILLFNGPLGGGGGSSWTSFWEEGRVGIKREIGPAFGRGVQTQKKQKGLHRGEKGREGRALKGSETFL